MARKKSNTIQVQVDTYAAQRDKEIKLREAISKATQTKHAAGAALVAHVKATTPGGKVAFHAANGDTLVVSPHTSSNPFWNNAIDVVKPGAQKLPEPEKPAVDTDAVVKALLDGKIEAAQKILNDTVANTLTIGTGAHMTATEALAKQDGAQLEARMAGLDPKILWADHDAILSDNQLDAYKYIFRRMYGFENLPRYSGFVTGRWTGSAKAIEQQTYKSATMGPIALSKRAKDLLVQNREAIQAAVGQRDYNAAGMQVSKSRGLIAQYISELEQRVNGLTAELTTQRYRKG